jgi:prepilin-type N-terminal cleavage/methylation domain-containing protein
MDQGFSLTEVLISLLLMTTASLTLLKHQWQTSQLFNDIHMHATALSVLDNATEQFIVNHKKLATDQPFTLTYTNTHTHQTLRSTSHPTITIQISWALQETIMRQLVLG